MTAHPHPLDQAAVEMLTHELLLCVKAHYLRRPTARSTAQEILNAMAVIAAHIIAGAGECGDAEGAERFFQAALSGQLAMMEHDARHGARHG